LALIEHLEKLRHFHKLTQYRSISETAEATGISQAGLSKSIASLEDVLGSKLFLRTNQGLVLTNEGELALRATVKILGEASTLEANLRSLKAAKFPKKLKIGMYDSIAIYFFGDLINYLNAIYKTIEIELLVDTSTSLSQAVRDETVDLAIGVNLQRRKTKGAEFFLLFEDDYSFYVSPKVEALAATLPLIIHPVADDLQGVTVEKHLSSLIAKTGAHRAYNFETIKSLTVQGLGIGVLPTQVAKPLIQQKLLVHVQVPKVKSHFGRHEIGFLASEDLLAKHREFALDIYRLGEKWSKS
jgi:DNA-binding transcriptional LysR family regulator